MNRFLAYFLVVLLLLQTLGQQVLVVDYQLNKERITAQYCVNKARPQLQCNGKCHLAKQLRKAEGSDKKAPAGNFAKIKLDVLPTIAFVLPGRQPGQLPARHFPPRPAGHCAAGTSLEVFRPPLLLA